ncbi:MAG: hypothetical protein GWN58_01830 [Anaerolineae bacterium]|nr:hypothetical protein [Anaerolineae bacterium]
MKNVKCYERNGVLHAEVPGAIVNVHMGLSDKDGNEVTTVVILCNDYPGDRWCMPDFEDTKTLSVRVVKREDDERGEPGEDSNPDSFIIWHCITCDTENEDNPELTCVPLCVKCSAEYDWEDLQEYRDWLEEEDAQREN